MSMLDVKLQCFDTVGWHQEEQFSLVSVETPVGALSNPAEPEKMPDETVLCVVPAQNWM